MFKKKESLFLLIAIRRKYGQLGRYGVCNKVRVQICRHKSCSPLFYASILSVSLCCKIVTQFLALHPTYIFSVVWLYIYIYMYMYKLLTIAFLHVYERIIIIRFQIHLLSFDKNTNWKTQFVTLKKKTIRVYLHVVYTLHQSKKNAMCTKSLI